MIKVQDRKRKSEKLTPDEEKQLKKFVHSHSTVVDAAFMIGIHRNVLDLVLIKGSGSPETIAKIRTALDAAKEGAA